MRDQTLLREMTEEAAFWKARALQLSEAVTDLSEQLAAVPAAPDAQMPADPIEEAEAETETG